MGVLGAARTRDWDNTFAEWAKPPGRTEQERCERAVTAIKKAIANSDALSRRTTRTFPQGSYQNRTNVRQDSDVDVCVLCSDTFHYTLPIGMTPQEVPIEPAQYSYSQYKNDVGAALVTHFGRENVKRGNKAFDIHENTYRIDADAVACFEYRLYFRSIIGPLIYHSGTALIPDRESRWVTNFPEQQYENGVAKNNETGRRFKALVRIVKSLRNEMAENNIPAADPITSFLIESLAWNWPTERFNAHSTWEGMVTAFIAWVWDGTKANGGYSSWREENGIKLLFGTHNDWSREQVHAFAIAAYNYIDNQ